MTRDRLREGHWYPREVERTAMGQLRTRPVAILMRECPECGKHTPHRVKEHAGVERWVCTACGMDRQWRVG